MLRSTLQTTFLIAVLALVMKVQAALPIRVLTHNIRYAANPPIEGETAWSSRRQLILNELKYNTLHNPEAFICLQEVLHEQLIDIISGLNSDSSNQEGDEWAYIGVGRDDGKQAGEYSPIIYRRAVWELENWETVWLNENGAVGKKGWDAGSVRIVTVGTFKHVASKRRVAGLCTHFDNAGTVSRRESAKILLKLVEFVTSPSSSGSAVRIPCFLAGDLNSETSGEAYQILSSQSSPLQDAKQIARWWYGNEHTFTGFDESGLELIDFVFVGPKTEEDWVIEGYSVLANRFEDGVYNSDHRAVVIDGGLST
ncbi:Nn.00g109240.m01.CDS01 [Neocucurbitaria sp. VM-36]